MVRRRIDTGSRAPHSHGSPRDDEIDGDQGSRTGEQEGLFGEDSVLRTVYRESVGLLGGGRSLLMQIAHPMVAAGVADHSDFRRDPLGRLGRTMDITLGIVFGDRRHAEEVLRRFHTIHAGIHGQLEHDAGSLPAGTPYFAHDPSLKLWVHATLVETGLMVYQRFVRHLSPGEQRRYYEDSMLLARRFGIPPSMIPPTLEDFEGYMEEMVSGESLGVTETTLSIARDVLYPDVWIVPRTAGPLARFVTAGLLPERLRDAYGFEWDARKQALLEQISRAIRVMLPLAPSWIRLVPQAGGGQFIEWTIRGRRR